MMIKSGVVAVIFAGFFLTGCVPKKAPSLVTSSGEAVAPPDKSGGGGRYGSMRKGIKCARYR